MTSGSALNSVGKGLALPQLLVSNPPFPQTLYLIRDPGSCILDPGSRILDPGSWILDPGSWMDPGSWILDPIWILDPRSYECSKRQPWQCQYVDSPIRGGLGA